VTSDENDGPRAVAKTSDPIVVRWKLVIVAALVGFAVGRLWPKVEGLLPGRSKPVARVVMSTESSAPLRVTAVTVAPAPFVETVTATGSLRADESIELQPEISGKIVAINFSEGAHVQKGDLLVKLNDADLRGTLQRDVWRRDLAELKEKRLAQLLQSLSVKQEDYDAALNELNVQRAEVAITEAQLAKTEIRAPFDGVIGLRFVSDGAYVTANTRIATLQNLEHLKIDFSVPEKYARRIRVGSKIAFSVPGGDRQFEGRIDALDPRIDAGTRTVLLRATYAGTDQRLLPGGFANVEFSLTEIPDAILIPNMAVVPGVSGKDVFVAVDGKVERRAVQTGTRNESLVHVIDGLKPGDRVITSGLQVLRAGLPVAVEDDKTFSPSLPRHATDAVPGGIRAAAN
jgi:membrane fusion protein (multidrug efflux system)